MGKAPVRFFEQRLRVPSYSCSLLRYLGSGNLPQVVGQDAPSYPPAHPFFCVMEAATQPEGAVEHADPPLYPRPKAEASPEPALVLMVFSLLGKLAALGQDHPLYSRLMSGFLVLYRI
jgi:hypothetical protein